MRREEESTRHYAGSGHHLIATSSPQFAARSTFFPLLSAAHTDSQNPRAVRASSFTNRTSVIS
jgi:hypothetical protein